MASEHKLQRLAARQHGLASRHQLISLGFSRHQIQHRLTTGRWSRAAPSVFDVAPGSIDVRRPLHAAVLASGGLASHRSAAWLHGLVDHAPPRPALIVGSTRFPRGIDATIHRSHTIRPSDEVRVDRIPTTSVPRTLFDLGSVVDLPVLSLAVNRALVARRTTVPTLLAAIDAGPLHGRRGIGPLREVLEPYRIDPAACASALESLLNDATARSSLPAFRRQHPVRVRGRRFSLDVAWPEHLVFVEADGLAHHTERSTFEADRRRQNLLVAAGWLPLRYTWADITLRPLEVIAEIAAVLSSRVPVARSA